MSGGAGALGAAEAAAGAGCARTVRVKFLGPAAADLPDELRVEAATLGELAAALADNERAQKWLKISAVAVNGKIASDLGAALATGDVVEILPPVCGG